MHALMFVLGLAALVVGAEGLVRGAARLAVSWGVSPLVVGLTVVAFGTSAPEMAVSVGAALSGSSDLAIGNVVGSNIANVLLILGIAALIAPLLVHEQIIRQEIPIMIGASLVVVASFVTLGLALSHPDPVLSAPPALSAAEMPAVQGRNHAATPRP
jgi:cation:H+ antiporter